MNKILREKTLPTKLAIQPVQGVIVNPANNQLYYSGEPAILIAREANSVFTPVWNQTQL
jgi:hypothetical protein